MEILLDTKRIEMLYALGFENWLAFIPTPGRITPLKQ